MDKHISELQEQLAQEHKDIAKYTQHVLEAINQLVEEHRRIVASNALTGINPDGEQEHTFYTSMNEVKRILIEELQKTVEDFKHLGDKHYIKNYLDGVKE